MEVVAMGEMVVGSEKQSKFKTLVALAKTFSSNNDEQGGT